MISNNDGQLMAHSQHHRRRHGAIKIEMWVPNSTDSISSNAKKRAQPFKHVRLHFFRFLGAPRTRQLVAHTFDTPSFPPRKWPILYIPFKIISMDREPHSIAINKF